MTVRVAGIAAICLSGVAALCLSEGVITPAPTASADPGIVTVEFPAVKDTFVNRGRSTTAYGTDSTLIANAGQDWRKSMLVGFEVSGLPEGTVVDSELVLTRESAQSTGVSVKPTLTPWSESDTWLTQPETGTKVGEAAPPPTESQIVVPMGPVGPQQGPWEFAVQTWSDSDPVRVWSREAGSGLGPVLRVRVQPVETCNQQTVQFDENLVPSCGALWGVVANAFGNRAGWPAQGPDSHRRYEAAVGRTMGIYSHYYSADARFPRGPEIELTREAGKRRVLYANWKIAAGTTFAAVADGQADATIDAQAAYLKANYPEKLFVSLQSEMEWQVDPTPGSGKTAADYARMYRHVVDRMRAHGVRNIIWVLSYGGSSKWATKPWFPELYPGDAYVDWISWHPYSSTDMFAKDFAGIVNETFDAADPGYPGMYDYLTRRHPGKPLMLGEFGVFHRPATWGWDLTRKAAFYTSIKQQLPELPALKALINFDTDYDEHMNNGYDITVLNDPGNLAAFQDLSRQPFLVDPVPPSESLP